MAEVVVWKASPVSVAARRAVVGRIPPQMLVDPKQAAGDAARCAKLLPILVEHPQSALCGLRRLPGCLDDAGQEEVEPLSPRGLGPAALQQLIVAAPISFSGKG